MKELHFNRNTKAANQMFLVAAALGVFVFLFFQFLPQYIWKYTTLVLCIIYAVLGFLSRGPNPLLKLKASMLEFNASPFVPPTLISYESIRSVTEEKNVLIIASDDCEKPFKIPLAAFFPDDQPLVAEKILNLDIGRKHASV